VRTEAGDSIVELDRFVQNFFPSAEVELGKASLHVACDKYARSEVPVSPPTEFGDDGFDVPPMSATPGWSFDHNSSGHRTRDEICVSELGRASLDDALRLQEPVKLWDHLRWDDDPQRAVEARAAAGTALDALVAAVRVNATDAESRGELVALLELARTSERPALVFVDDRTALPRSRFYLSLRGALRFVFTLADLGRPPDATWTFTKSDGAPITVVMARGKERIERTFALDDTHGTVMRAFLDKIVGWPTPAPQVVVRQVRY
jgi:hypothetical protein